MHASFGQIAFTDLVWRHESDERVKDTHGLATGAEHLNAMVVFMAVSDLDSSRLDRTFSCPARSIQCV